MADQLYFSRSTRLYIKQGANVWEIPVLDGFNFSQATNSSEVTLNEMSSSAGVSRRAKQMFNDSYAPAEWSFSTYARPFIGAGAGAGNWGDTNHHAVEEVLWANFIAVNSWSTGAWSKGVTLSGSNLIFDFDDSNSPVLGELELFFCLGSCARGTTTPTVYKITKAVINSVSVDFEIDGICTLNWSGFGATIVEEGSEPTATITEAASATSNFIRNRLTSLSITAADTTNFPGTDSDGVYNVILTGGSISMENNITFLTPETLCTVNQPIGHVTGTRSIGGSFTCYLNAAVGSSADLFEDLVNATDVVTNSFDLTFSIGGASAPKIVINLPQCHLEIPTHSIEDVIAVETNFVALPTSLDETDEATITYVGVAYS